MPTPDAPKASALNTSVPLRAPPSVNTGTRPFTAATTSATQSIVARRVSSLRPPWLDTMTPSAPCALAACASSPVTMPLMNSFPRTSPRKRSNHSRVSPGGASPFTCDTSIPAKSGARSHMSWRFPTWQAVQSRLSRRAARRNASEFRAPAVAVESTDSTMASAPADSARRTSSRVTVQSSVG